MLSSSNLTTAEILAVFDEEISARGGRVTDTFDDGERLFTRSVLHRFEDVRPGDTVQDGVALKATGEGVWLYPYLFRLACRNGAIMAQTLASRFLGDLSQQEPDAAVQSLRQAIAPCCAEEVFQDTVRTVRTAVATEVDLALTWLPHLAQLTAGMGPRLLPTILELFFQEGDQSQFGLANAITAVARDTQDPDLRWNLEELGGGVAIGTAPRYPAAGHALPWGDGDEPLVLVDPEELLQGTVAGSRLSRVRRRFTGSRCR